MAGPDPTGLPARPGLAVSVAGDPPARVGASSRCHPAVALRRGTGVVTAIATGKRLGNQGSDSAEQGRVRRAGPGPPEIEETRMDQLLLTPSQAAAALGIGRSKVYELMKAGDLASVRIGACRRIPSEALAEFLAGLRRAG